MNAERSYSHRGREALALRRTAEREAGTLPPLLVAAERVAATVTQGVHGRRRVGQGETFWQFREYEPGDTPNTIDWRQSGKGQRLFVRQMEWEAAQSVWLWADVSPSMVWRSNPELPEKAERARVLALALAILLSRAGERLGLLGGYAPAMSGRGVLTRLADGMMTQDPEKTGIPDQPLPRHSQVVLFSDFLMPGEELEARLSGYQARGVSGHLVQVLDPAEEALPYHGRARFEGLEGESDWLISKVEAVREHYLGRLQHHREGLSDLARRLGWRFTVHHSDQPAVAALTGIYLSLADSLARKP